MRHKHSCVHDPNDFHSCHGDKYHKLYDSKLNEDGTYTLTESSRVDIQKQINARAAQCDINLIMQKLSYGDTSALATKPPQYGDFTVFPKTYAEALDLVKRSEDAFNSLSPDVKSKFDNDQNKWFATIGTQFWLDSMGLSPAPVPVVEGGDNNV